MTSFEIKTSTFNPLTVITGIACVTITAIMAFSIIPNAMELGVVSTEVDVSNRIPVVIIAGLVMPWIFFCVAVMSTLGRKIIIEGNLAYFGKKLYFGFGQWKTMMILDFSKVISVTDKKKTTFMYTGSTLIPIAMYWLVFETEDGQKQEVVINPSEVSGIKNLLYFLRGRFPDIKLNTDILRDSSEKMSGIDKLIKL